MKTNIIRAAIYSFVFTIAVVLPRTPSSEAICPYKPYAALSYIGENIGVVKPIEERIFRSGVCNTYIGFPFIYIADIYDVRSVTLSFTRLIMNILFFLVVVELLLFLVKYFIEQHNRSNIE